MNVLNRCEDDESGRQWPYSSKYPRVATGVDRPPRLRLTEKALVVNAIGKLRRVLHSAPNGISFSARTFSPHRLFRFPRGNTSLEPHLRRSWPSQDSAQSKLATIVSQGPRPGGGRAPSTNCRARYRANRGSCPSVQIHRNPFVSRRGHIVRGVQAGVARTRRSPPPTHPNACRQPAEATSTAAEVSVQTTVRRQRWTLDLTRILGIVLKTGTGTATNSGLSRATIEAVAEPVPVFISPVHGGRILSKEFDGFSSR